MNGEYYKGYSLDFDPSRPMSGQWRAVRHGVGLNNNSLEGLKRMIDFKVKDSQNYFNKTGVYEVQDENI